MLRAVCTQWIVRIRRRCRLHPPVLLNQHVWQQVSQQASEKMHRVLQFCRPNQGCESRSGGVKGSVRGLRKFKKIQSSNDRWAPHSPRQTWALLQGVYATCKRGCFASLAVAVSPRSPWRNTVRVGPCVLNMGMRTPGGVRVFVRAGIIPNLCMYTYIYTYICLLMLIRS